MPEQEKLVVTPDYERPARMDGTCFYCHQPIGEFHGDDCVALLKAVRVVATIEFEYLVPRNWGARDVKFHMGEEGGHAREMIDQIIDVAEEEGYFCNDVQFDYLGDADDA